MVGTNPNWPVLLNSSNQLYTVPYIQAKQGGTQIDTSSLTGILSISLGN